MITLRRAVFLILLSIGLWAAQIVNPADIPGDGVAHVVDVNNIARWVSFTSVSGSGVIRVGDSNVSTSRGQPIAGGGTYYLPDLVGRPGYDLSQIYYLVPIGTTMSIQWLK